MRGGNDALPEVQTYGRKIMYTVGEFSKICRVSVKTLRYYGKIKLLTPSKVDKTTGYRYYDAAQIERMLLIGKLKRYGFSLRGIRMLLELGDDAAFRAALARQLEKLKQSRRDVETLISELSAHLDNFERTGDIMGYRKEYEVVLANTPDRYVLSNRHMMSVDEFGMHYSLLYERAARERINLNGVSGAIYHDSEFDPERSDIELIIGVTDAERADRVINGGLTAMTVHKGAYSALSEAYSALTSWIEDNGYVWDGAPYDIYTRTRFDGLSPEDWETEVYFPVRKA